MFCLTSPKSERTSQATSATSTSNSDNSSVLDTSFVTGAAGETRGPPTTIQTTSTTSMGSSDSRVARPVLADIDALDGAFRRTAALVVMTYLTLVGITFGYLVPGEGDAGYDAPDPELDRSERILPRTAFFILIVSFCLQITPIALQWIRSAPHQAPAARRHQEHQLSGIIVAALVIQFIALMTNALLGWGPRAVVLDPVSGSRVFLIRWCEWTPLSGFMTLLAESADLPNAPKAWRGPIIFALCQSLSTICGIFFPYCRNTIEWVIVMIISCVLFLAIFPRVVERRKMLQATPRGKTVMEREYYDRRRFSYYLMLMCSICWSVLVTLYFIDMVIHMVCAPDSWWRFPTLDMAWHTVADVLAKVIYMKIIFEAHQCVFASDLRTVRQLNELKQLMSTLWVSSSDVIVISTKLTKDRNATMLSPSFLKLVGANPPPMEYHRNTDPNGRSRERDHHHQEDQLDRSDSSLFPSSSPLVGVAALVLETDRGRIISAYYVDTNHISGDPYPERIDPSTIKLATENIQHNAVQQALRITNAAWMARMQSEDEPLRALSIVHCDESQGEGKSKIMCEMKVSRHTTQTVVAIVRNVTERYRRFEAESRVHAETLARQRDMHTANRFTRHEVKNGLLSGIELCCVLGRSLKDLKTMVKDGESSPGDAQNLLQNISTMLDEKSMNSLVDLDGTLRGVLDTVLAEVMAREVVHG